MQGCWSWRWKHKERYKHKVKATMKKEGKNADVSWSRLRLIYNISIQWASIKNMSVFTSFNVTVWSDFPIFQMCYSIWVRHRTAKQFRLQTRRRRGEKREKNNNKWVAGLSIISHITQLSTLWGRVTARTADWGQSGWPELLQSVISMFDQPDYRDLTDHMVGGGRGEGRGINTGNEEAAVKG